MKPVKLQTNQYIYVAIKVDAHESERRCNFKISNFVEGDGAAQRDEPYLNPGGKLASSQYPLAGLLSFEALG
jgi:hypothetical protein